ncbi:DUF348 domain-containing protein [Candidatus Saccharibacteria bacterium]|nr:DUF348 domain-containing protein [Candidatus Saccharibacteria bacterium]
MRRSYNFGRRYRPYIDRFHDHPYALPVATFLVLFFVSLASFIGFNARTDPPSDAHIIEFSIEGKRQSIPTRAKTVREFLTKIDIKLEKHDIVEPGLDTRIYSDKFHVNVYRARPVIIVESGKERKFALSAASTPRSVARQAGVEVYPEDYVESKLPDNFLKEGVLGEKVVIERSTPAGINLYGSQVPVRTHAKTVRDLLREKNITVAGKDEVRPATNTPIKPGLQIFVVRPGTKLLTEESEIPMPEEVLEDASLSFGVSVVRQEGSPGKKVVTYQVEMENGKEVGRKKIQEVVSIEPVKQIVARGKAFDINKDKEAIMAQAGIKSSDYPYVDYIVSRESGWRPNATNGMTWGLCQALPGSKMASAGADWRENPVTQLRWCNWYATQGSSNFNSWQGAYNFWTVNHWW